MSKLENVDEASMKPIVHTPGPWEVIEKPYGFAIEPSICWMGNSSKHNENENRANARLIAAAPELADALRDLHDHQNGPPLIRYEEEWKAAMGRAIELLKRVGH